MKRFSFRLENILNLRKKIEQGREKQFSSKKAQVMKIEAEIDDMKAKLDQFVHNNQFVKGIFSASEFIAVEDYVRRMEGAINKLKCVHQEKKKELEQSLEQLKQARKSTKMIARLKERSLDQYKQQLSREEDIHLDDINQHIALTRNILTIEDVMREDF
ncbi:MAG: flagellar export protein FliJ [Spirochaetota bacterium]